MIAVAPAQRAELIAELERGIGRAWGRSYVLKAFYQLCEREGSRRDYDGRGVVDTRPPDEAFDTGRIYGGFYEVRLCAGFRILSRAYRDD